jgi:ribose-phosphate pyrophosphokinase
MKYGDSLSIKVFADLINALKFASVTIWDPHSDVTTAILDNVVVIDQAYCMQCVIPIFKLPMGTKLIAPDAGAVKKTANVAKVYGVDYIVAGKSRSLVDNSIEGTSIQADQLLSTDKRYLIVDDICDGGRTFIALAKAIREHVDETVPIDLYVTHGIFSYGLEPLFKGGITNIYVANMFSSNISHPNLFK